MGEVETFWEADRMVLIEKEDGEPIAAIAAENPVSVRG